jgi:hypothetical protein
MAAAVTDLDNARDELATWIFEYDIENRKGFIRRPLASLKPESVMTGLSHTPRTKRGQIIILRKRK